MYRKILVTGVTAAAIVGAGTAALAATGSDTTSGTPTARTTSSAPSSTHGKKHHSPLRHAVHAKITVKTKKGYVTKDLINGTVTSVSASSITVLAADKTSETYVVGKDTTVLVKAATKGAKPTASTISKVSKGQHVVVTGTGTSTLTATRVLDLGTK